VELNHRNLDKKENPDYDPWSVRQSAIYQQYNSQYDRITFILIFTIRNRPNRLARSRTESMGEKEETKRI
jgi:hypothetical protein